MIAWRTLACTVVVCLAASGCGDDGDLSTGLSSLSGGSNANTESSSSSSSSSTSPSSTGTPDPTTGDATTNDTNQTTNTTPPGTTSGPDTTTTGPDTTTTTDTTNTTMTTMTTMTTQQPGGCGNGAIDPNEQCDGANLNGFTCESLGNAGGTLGCDPVTCTFDTSMCMGNDPGTTG